MQGRSVQATTSKLDTLEQWISVHITTVQQTRAALAIYRTNKQ